MKNTQLRQFTETTVETAYDVGYHRRDLGSSFAANLVSNVAGEAFFGGVVGGAKWFHANYQVDVGVSGALFGVLPAIKRRKLVTSAAEVPTYKSGAGDFDQWFDSLSPRTVKRLYRDIDIKDKIEKQLRGFGGDHEFLMVSLAPHWKKWGVTMKEFRKTTMAISELNEGGVAKGWKHSRGVQGVEAPNSTTVHNELADIITSSASLAEFRKQIGPWAEKWLRDGVDNLPKLLRT